jgi:hypothetical protein
VARLVDHQGLLCWSTSITPTTSSARVKSTSNGTHFFLEEPTAANAGAGVSATSAIAQIETARLMTTAVDRKT